MDPRRYLIALLPFLFVQTFSSAAPSKDLLTQARSYRPANIHNGCFIEAAIFCDWFMGQNEKAWATPLLGIKAEIAGKEFGHAVALFEVKERLYIWDITYGVIPLTVSRKEMTKAGSLQAVAEEAYRAYLAKLEMQAAKTGHVQEQITNIAIQGVPLDFAADRISLTRPVLKLSVQTANGTIPAIAFVYSDRIFVFDEANGTTGGTFGPDPLGYLKRIVRSVYGPDAGFKILQRIEPRTTASIRIDREHP